MAFKKGIWESNCLKSSSTIPLRTQEVESWRSEVIVERKYSYLVAKCNWNPSLLNLTSVLCSSFHTTDERNSENLPNIKGNK